MGDDVTAADLIYPSEIEIANPELHIATLDSPDARLDAEWRRELIARAREELERELEAGGRRSHWLLFRDWFLDEGDDAMDVFHHPYAYVARRENSDRVVRAVATVLEGVPPA